MRFHLVGLPHTQTTREYVACAFTQNVVKFCAMMTARGHECIVYSGEDNDAPCVEHVPVVTKARQREWFGEPDHGKFYRADWNHAAPHWIELNAVAAAEMRKRTKRDDLVLLIAGCQAGMQGLLPEHKCAEFAVGYEGPRSQLRCFASQALRHYVCGWHREPDGRPTDAVIPHYFDPEALPLADGPREDWFLYLGRVVPRKGVAIAVETCRRIGAKLVVAGQVGPETGGLLDAPHVTYAGVADEAKRLDLLGRARALFVPTQYFEPFGMVAVEAMLRGTPAITSGWGAFPEIVRQFRGGFVCGSETEYAAAALNAHRIPPAMVRESALRFGYDAVAPQYERWFEQLQRTAR